MILGARVSVQSRRGGEGEKFCEEDISEKGVTYHHQQRAAVVE